MLDRGDSSKCSICGKEDSVIFVKIVSGDKIEQKGLCAGCAIKYLQDKDNIKELNFVDQKLLHVIEEMKDLLTGIISNINLIGMKMKPENSDQKQTSENHGQECSYCGLKFEQFKETGMLGCPECYSTFKEYIGEFVFELERGTSHKGKMPKKFAKLYLLKQEILFLNNKLEKLLFNEEYEEAEKVKRKLEKLIGNFDTRRHDEIH
jgi:protein arginine kinase activator